MAIQNYDEVDFIDRRSGSPAFLRLGKSEGGEVSVGLSVLGDCELDLTVTTADARRLGERLIAVAQEISDGR